MKEIETGDIVKGVVTGIESYGIFVHVNEKFNGLIHISEVSSYFVRDLHNYVRVGEHIYAQVLNVDNEKGTLQLSIKNINYKEYNPNDDIQETRKGFLPLKEHLDDWIKEKKEYYDNLMK